MTTPTPEEPDPRLYGQPQYGQPQYGQPQSGQTGYGPGLVLDHREATTVLILGILSLVLCGLLGPFAWIMGNRVVGEIDASGGRIGGRSSANAGRICGIISSVLMGFSVLLLVLLFVFGGILAASSP